MSFGKSALFLCTMKEYIYLFTGAGGCHNSGNPKSGVMVFVEDDSEQTMYIVEYCKGITLLDYRCRGLS